MKMKKIWKVAWAIILIGSALNAVKRAEDIYEAFGSLSFMIVILYIIFFKIETEYYEENR